MRLASFFSGIKRWLDAPPPTPPQEVSDGPAPALYATIPRDLAEAIQAGEAPLTEIDPVRQYRKPSSSTVELTDGLIPPLTEADACL